MLRMYKNFRILGFIRSGFEPMAPRIYSLKTGTAHDKNMSDA